LNSIARTDFAVIINPVESRLVLGRWVLEQNTKSGIEDSLQLVARIFTYDNSGTYKDFKSVPGQKAI
jgi:hypothetical protein